eukprot:3720823-Prorocentrum_lima.AAC.1
MTSSLVGSEMCIRDRFIGSQLTAWLLFLARDCVLQVGEWWRGGSWSCLLYTSDATDDMQCVDLG